MHDGGRTESAQGRADPNDRNSTPRPTSTTTNRHNPAFFGAGGRTRTVRVVQGCTMAVAQSRCTMQRPQRPQTQGCVIVLAQSFARCETNRASTIRQPRPTSTTTNRHSPAFWCGGCENTQLAGKARMPYKMNTQSFKQGCIKTATLSRYARMHKDSHTKPLCKDA